MPLSPISVFQPRGQCIVLLIAALKENGVTLTKREAVQWISEQRWFAIQPEDWKPYPSQTTTHEPRWKTLIAWARKDAVLRNFLLDHERDSWALSRQGHQLWDAILKRFCSGEWPVAKGYLWRHEFKCKLCPSYQPSANDARRPQHLYRDIFDIDRYFADLFGEPIHGISQSTIHSMAFSPSAAAPLRRA